MSTVTPQTPPLRDLVARSGSTGGGRAERARMQRWLHDHTLQVLEYIAAGGYDEQVAVAHLREVAAAAAGELRTQIGEAAVPPPGDVRAVLADTVGSCQLRAGRLHIDFSCEGPLPLLGAARVAALAGATREAINNACKHARATRVSVACIVDTEGELVVSIRDDGKGFDPAGARYGHGIANSIVERMLACGGSAGVESAPGTGTLVTLRLGAGARSPSSRVAA